MTFFVFHFISKATLAFAFYPQLHVLTVRHRELSILWNSFNVLILSMRLKSDISAASSFMMCRHLTKALNY